MSGGSPQSSLLRVGHAGQRGSAEATPPGRPGARRGCIRIRERHGLGTKQRHTDLALGFAGARFGRANQRFELPVRQLMGPVAIAELSGSAAQLGFAALFQFMSMISLNLGLINLLPVPVLDGGHIAILAVEGVTRRDLSVRVKERILIAGSALIVLLMVTVIYNDVMRLFR